MHNFLKREKTWSSFFCSIQFMYYSFPPAPENKLLSAKCLELWYWTTKATTTKCNFIRVLVHSFLIFLVLLIFSHWLYVWWEYSIGGTVSFDTSSLSFFLFIFVFISTIANMTEHFLHMLHVIMCKGYFLQSLCLAFHRCLKAAHFTTTITSTNNCNNNNKKKNLSTQYKHVETYYVLCFL